MKNDADNRDRTFVTPCPRCAKETLYVSSNPYRPFCSYRCQTIDLADWAQEDHRISEPLSINNLQLKSKEHERRNLMTDDESSMA